MDTDKGAFKIQCNLWLLSVSISEDILQKILFIIEKLNLLNFKELLKPGLSKKMQEIQDWLTENVGHPPKWCLGRINIDDTIQTFQILFKHPEDVVAFKLRWL